MRIVCLAGFWLALAPLVVQVVQGAENPSDWQFSQQLQISQPGLVELKLPPSTIDQAQPQLQDLRLVDPEGREVPFYLKLPKFSQRSTSVLSNN